MNKELLNPDVKVNIDGIYAQMSEDMNNVTNNANKRSKFLLKTGNGKYLEKNGFDAISKGGARYIENGKPFYFLSEVAAFEAKRVWEAKGERIIVEEIN